MDFKEALIAHLQGERVECRHQSKQERDWMPFEDGFKNTPLRNVSGIGFGRDHTFRLAPRSICVNGVEVPAPESVAPNEGAVYCVPVPSLDGFCHKAKWANDQTDLLWLERGLVYIDSASCIARAKAMLLTKES